MALAINDFTTGDGVARVTENLDMDNLIENFLQESTEKERHRHIMSVITLVSLIAIFWIIFSASANDTWDMNTLITNGDHWFLIVSISFLLMFVCAITPLPAEAVTVANGALFGPILGTLLTWVSAMFGAAVTFYLGRRLLQRSNMKLLEHDKYHRLMQWTNKWGVKGLMLARLIPVVPFFALNIGAAFLPVSGKKYLLVTGIGILPHIMIICCFSGHIAGH